MSDPAKPSRPGFTDAAREAALALRKAKREDPDSFGIPELFIVKASERAFTWELRRFGGVALQRGSEAFPHIDLARADGELALAALRAISDLPTFKREPRT